MKKPTKKEHWVQRSYLKNFSFDDEQKMVMVFDKKENQIRRINTRNLCVQIDTYEKKIQNSYFAHNFIENGLARWENHFNKTIDSILRKIIRNNNPDGLIASHEDKFWLHYMFFIQLMRLPEMFEKLPKIPTPTKNDKSLDADTNKKYQYLFKAHTLGLLPLDEGLPLPLSFECADFYQKQNTLVFLRIPNDSQKEFFTSDQPVVLTDPSIIEIHTENRTEQEPQILTFYYPLSYQIAVISVPRNLLPPQRRNRTITLESAIDKRYIDNLNNLMYSSAKRFLIGHKILDDVKNFTEYGKSQLF